MPNPSFPDERSEVLRDQVTCSVSPSQEVAEPRFEASPHNEEGHSRQRELKALCEMVGSAGWVRGPVGLELEEEQGAESGRGSSRRGKAGRR